MLFSRELGASMAHLVESVELLQALESRKGWKLLKSREVSDTCFLDVQSVNPNAWYLLFLGSNSELGVRSQNRKINRLDEDEKLAELLSVAVRKTGSL